MRIGFVELLLILLIASLTIGPSAALWVDRWLRRANRASAAAAAADISPPPISTTCGFMGKAPFIR